MTQEDLNMLTPPKYVSFKYQRQLIYNMLNYQKKLFNNLIKFGTRITTLIEKKKAMITFLD